MSTGAFRITSAHRNLISGRQRVANRLPIIAFKRNGSQGSNHDMTFSILESTLAALKDLIDDTELPLPDDVRRIVERTTFTNASTPILPCPFKQLEAAAALKAIEAAVANVIGERRFGYKQDVTIDLQHATLFLFMAYLATVDGLGKQDKGVKAKLKGTLFSGEAN